MPTVLLVVLIVVICWLYCRHGPMVLAGVTITAVVWVSSL